MSYEHALKYTKSRNMNFEDKTSFSIKQQKIKDFLETLLEKPKIPTN